jgi:glycosyltransferase involved in cell wall biosynthesis
MPQPGEVVVSVLMTAYNQQAFVREAVESVLAQDFAQPFELVIGDDYSTDDTRRILGELRDADPRIRLVLHERNLGICENNRRLFAECRGRHVAFLECDDFWTCTDKLSRQVQFLEDNPDYAGCGHAVTVVDQSGSLLSEKRDRSGDVTFADVVLRHRFHTSSFMLRRDAVNRYMTDRAWRAIPDRVAVDRALLAFAAAAGPLRYEDFICSSYRVHDGGNYSSQSLLWVQEKTAAADEPITRFFPREYRSAWRYKTALRRIALVHDTLETGRRLRAWRHLGAAVRLWGAWRYHPAALAGAFLRLAAPPVWRVLKGRGRAAHRE